MGKATKNWSLKSSLALLAIAGFAQTINAQGTDTTTTTTEETTTTVATTTTTEGTTTETFTSTQPTTTETFTSTEAGTTETFTSTGVSTTVTGTSTAPGTTETETSTEGGSTVTGTSTHGTTTETGTLTETGTSTETGTIVTTASSGSSSVVSSAVSSAVSGSATNPAITPVPLPSNTPIIFGVSRNTGGLIRRGIHLNKRQAPGGFLGGAGPVNPSSCSDATPFNVVGGQLASDGQYISTNPGIPYEMFRTSATLGAISTTFGTGAGGNLVWANTAFSGGEAGFCQDDSGQVWITFTDAAPPFACAPVTLIPYPASNCVNGILINPTPANNGTLVLGEGTYAFPLTGTPAGICATVTESWIAGQTTLLP